MDHEGLEDEELRNFVLFESLRVFRNTYLILLPIYEELHMITEERK